MSTADKIRAYLAKNPNAPAADVAKKCDTSVSYVYHIKTPPKRRAPRAAQAAELKQPRSLLVPPPAPQHPEGLARGDRVVMFMGSPSAVAKAAREALT